MKALFTAIKIVVVMTILTGCEDDVDFDTNNRSVDVRLDNAELIVLGTFQGTILPHIYLPLYDFLDASDLPDTSQGSGYVHSCVNAPIPAENKMATATYRYSRGLGQTYQKGDVVSVDYSYCDRGDGYIVDGSISLKYSKVNGWNTNFMESSTSQCLAALQAEYSGATTFEYESDSVRFRNVAENVVIEAIDIIEQETEPGEDPLPDVYEVVASNVVGRNDTALIVRYVPEEDPPVDTVTSIDGDQLYLLEKSEHERIACQQYERVMKATVSDLSVIVDNTGNDDLDMQFSMSGSVTLVEGSDNLDNFTNELRNSSFSTRVKQGNLTESFSLRGLTLTEGYSLSQGSYFIEIEGEIKSDAIFGTAEIGTNTVMTGLYEDGLPTSGIISIFGRDLEQIAVIARENSVRLNIDLNGDSDGNAISDTDEILFTTWDALLSRDFLEVP